MEMVEEQKHVNELLDNLVDIIKSGNLDAFKNAIKAVKGLQNKDILHSVCNDRGIDLISLICKHNKKKLLRHILEEAHNLHYFTSEDKCKVTKYREESFYYAMCFSHFELIEMLYDYWTGDLHWMGYNNEYNNFDIVNLEQLNSSLDTALNRYLNRMLSKKFFKRRIDQYMMFNVQSLMAFNEFQRELYTMLNKLKENLMSCKNEPEDVIRKQETYAIRKMILDVLECYNKHTKKPESMIKTSFYDTPAVLLKSLQDSSTLLPQTSLYVIYELYFRKLDYNLCLLILNNLHSLKLRLSMPKDAYQELENIVYLFIHHVSSKWSCYMPKRKKMKTITFSAQHNNIDCFFSLKFNAKVFKRGLHIIYLERRNFESALNCFKTKLKNRNVEENLRKDHMELPNEEVNSLMFLPDLRDIYSLKKISQHIAQLYSIDVKYTKQFVFLFIERTLQIVGEFLKATNNTLHLQPTTEALIKAEISVEVVNDLKILRDMLCHTKNGELLKRIEAETNNSNVFHFILQELIFVKKKIDEVIMIHKPFVERAIILNGLSLIEKRKNEMDFIVANDFFIVLRGLRLNITNECCLRAHENNFYEMFWKPKGFTKELMHELKLLVEHSLQLELKLLLVNRSIRHNLTRKFFTYREAIGISMKKNFESKKNWQRIIVALKEKVPSIPTLLDYPNENDANRIKSYSTKVDLGDLSCLTEDGVLFADAENHWKFIKNLLEFIILKTNFQSYKEDELKQVTRDLEIINDGYRNNNVQKIVNDYLAYIENKLDRVTRIDNLDQTPDFAGIKELTVKLTKVNFLTQDEKIYLTKTIMTSPNSSSDKKKQSKIKKMIDKINNGVAIPKRELTSFMITLKLDKQVQNKLMNLVMGYKRDPLIPECLIKRITLLKEITKNLSVDQLVLQYKINKTFRILFEVLVFDIFAALEDAFNNKIVKKSSRLLTEINLRNVLIHGNPLLEVVGNVLDSNDLPTELITKALEFIKDETSIVALCALRDLDFNFTQIHKKTLSLAQQTLVTEFKKSTRWREYIKLISKSKQTKKNLNGIDELSLNLLKAVTDKNSVLVQKIIIEEGAKVDFVDNHNYTVLHHAAMKGSVEVIKVLLTNGAEVNVRGNYNFTALHCSAMNGFEDSVVFLLENGADCYSLDDRGRTPLYLAGQRNHKQVCQILVHAMKK